MHGKVTRFEAPGLHAFNFLLEDALGGGGMASRRIDPQGKAFGRFQATGVRPTFATRLQAAGVSLTAGLFQQRNLLDA